MTEENITNFTKQEKKMLEKIFGKQNLNLAYKKVLSNKGSSGVDDMEVGSLLDYLVQHKKDLLTKLEGGRYRPKPVKYVEIPKENGKKRQLGIPTVLDRMIQQSIHQVLSPIWEEKFSDYSYGFRPGRSAHQALLKCLEYMDQGYEYAIDMDLENFFDTVNHSKLIQLISSEIKDGRVVSLIHKYLNAGVVKHGKYERREKGVPQGGPLSPLLSNILLHELDMELERRGHKFVRYADDVLILTKSRRSAERVLESIVKYIETKLYLMVNREKTKIGRISRISFLGHTFARDKSGEAILRVATKSRKKMKARIKELTHRSNGWSYEYRKLRLRQFITGWVNYFRYAKMESFLNSIDGWYRHRLRSMFWKLWKTPKTRIKNLLKLGARRDAAISHGNASKGHWRMGHTKAMHVCVSIKVLRQAGYLFFTDHYLKVKN